MENQIKKLAAIYCRVSGEDQATKGISIEVQESVCAEMAKKKKDKVVEVICDRGKSGGNLNRKGIKRLIHLIETKAINSIYMVHADRLARNTSDHIKMMDFFEEKGIELNLVYQISIDRTTATGYMTDTMLAAVNEHHRLISKEKTILVSGCCTSGV